MAEKTKTLFRVIPIRILKPVDSTTWDELGRMLRDTRYRVYRLANLGVSEAYLGFHLFRTGQASQFKTATMGQLSQRLRQMLLDEGTGQDDLNRFSPKGALPDTVAGALAQYKIRSVRSPSKWQQVVRGKTSLPTFRADMAIPIRCDKADQRRLERNADGEIELDLMICRRPYPRVLLATGTLGPGQKAVLDRLLANETNSKDGYRQRLYEIKEDSQTHQWWLSVTYEFPAPSAPVAHPDIIEQRGHISNYELFRNRFGAAKDCPGGPHERFPSRPAEDSARAGGQGLGQTSRQAAAGFDAHPGPGSTIMSSSSSSQSPMRIRLCTNRLEDSGGICHDRGV